MPEIYGRKSLNVGPGKVWAEFYSDQMRFGIELSVWDGLYLHLGPFSFAAYWGSYRQYRPIEPQRIKDARRVALGRIFVEKLTVNADKTYAEK